MSDSGCCEFCDREIPGAPVESQGLAFCSTGCEGVYATLGGTAPEEAPVQRPEPDGTERLFLHVDGLHSPTCEAFLEERARQLDGVTDAEASYVTETIRVDFDPGRVAPPEVAEALSTVGYTAVPSDDSGAVESPGAPADRGIEEMLGFRYVAGVVFGTFMLLPYVMVVYPAQFPSVFGGLFAGLFEGGLLTGGTVLLLPMFLGLAGFVLLFTGLPLLRGAYVSLATRRPNTDLLVAIPVVAAYLYGTVALLTGRLAVYFDLTILIAATAVAATYYESLVKRRGVGRLTDLTVSQVSEAQLAVPGGIETVDVDALRPGDRVLVRQGERVPVDGRLVDGDCTVDEAVVTGESLPVPKTVGDRVLGGSIVTDQAAVIEVEEGATGSIDRLTTAVWHLQSADHGLQRRTDRFAVRVVPAVLGIAVLAGAGTLFLSRSPVTALVTVLTTCLVGTPWILGVTTPLSVARNITAALERGIVIFDETVFERLRETDVVVFDKTGTLTTGQMEVVEADAPPELLSATAALERRASHPVGSAIVAAFGDESGETRSDGGGVDARPSAQRVTEWERHGLGVQATVDGRDVLVGTLGLFAERGWAVDESIEAAVGNARGVGRLPVVVGRDGHAEGLIVVGDRLRETWEAPLARLSDRGVEVVVLTGDDEAATARFADHPQVEHVFPSVPPEGKVATVRRLQTEGHVTMVGDGTNDAPALARADLGVALGGGTALASHAADLTILEDDLGAVETAFDLAAAARRRVRQNTVLAVVYNVLTIPLAVAGLLNPFFAMAVAVLSLGLVGLNTSRELGSTAQRTGQ